MMKDARRKKSEASTNLCVLDFEASGLDNASYPIEVAVWLRGDVHSWLIHPEQDWNYWCETAESMHGITRQMLIELGKPAAVVAEELNSVLNSVNVVYSDAANWDDFWLQRLYVAAKVKPGFAIASVFSLLNENQREMFLLQRDMLVSSGVYRHHRAGEDVKLIRQALMAALESL